LGFAGILAGLVDRLDLSLILGGFAPDPLLQQARLVGFEKVP
jgi:hypothetical protein